MFNKPKVSVIITLQDINEEHYEKCFDSIFGQKLDSVEIICIKSDENFNLNFLDDYLSKYDLIKIFTEDYFQNNFNSIINSDYIIFLNPTDWFLVVGLENAYNIAIENNLDILINSYHNYHHYSGDIDDPHQEEYSKLNKLIDFSDSMFNDILFNMPKYPFNLYKTNFIKNNNFKVPLNLYQHITFFLISAVKTSNIMYNNKQLLYNNLDAKRDNYNLICNDFIILSDTNNESTLNVDEIVNTNIDLFIYFKDNHLYGDYKFYLLNYIFKIFMNIFSINFKNDEYIFEKIHNAVSTFFHNYHEDLVLNLKPDYLTFYRTLLISKTNNELKLYIENKNILIKNEEQEIAISKKDKQINNLSNISKQLEESKKELSIVKKENSKNVEKLNVALVNVKKLEQHNEHLDNQYMQLLLKNVKLNNEYHKLNTDYRNLNEKYSILVNENSHVLTKINVLENSRSWKLTKIFRKIGYSKSIFLIVVTGILFILLILSVVILSMLILKLI